MPRKGVRGAKYAAHIKALCKEHEIEHVVDDDASAAASLERRAIRAPRVSGPARYLTALHEVGHIVTQIGDPADTIVRKEERAWRWALQNGIEPPSENGARSLPTALQLRGPSPYGSD